jgi:hypothetical protein|tara:strand:+ start:300 stop:575 length:276 start_codon:yes stop_codon:yes gene_type:complete
MRLEDFKKGDMIGMRFSYFNREYHEMTHDRREIHGIIVGFTQSAGWQVLITYDSEKKRKNGFVASYSDTWVKNALKGDNVWKISEVNESEV